MFYVSTKEKPYFYKARRVKKGTSSKGEPYTFVSISTKDKFDGDKWKDATLYVWKDIDIKEGDSIAFYNISGVNFKETESGFKKFSEIAISTEQVKVKSAEASDEPAKKKDTPKEAPKAAEPEAPQFSPATNNSGFEELYGGSDDDLPF